MELFGFSVRVSLFIALFFPGDAVLRNCICNNMVCKAAFKFSSNFQTAKHLCHDMRGQLMAVPSKAASNHLRDLLGDLHGDFWVGLRLPDGQCTNVTSPLKGYMWTSDLHTTEFSNWRSDETVCSSRCVAVSTDLKWTEKLCQHQSEGFLCENVPEDDCSSFTLETPVYSIVYHHPMGCLSGNCEHLCHVENDESFRCSCFPDYVINKQDQYKCDDNRCTSERCIAKCDRNSCMCDKGYILDVVNAEMHCEDLNECEHGYYCDRDHYCFNSLGSYECSCRNGFTLVGEDKCVETKSDESFTKSDESFNQATNDIFPMPSLNYTTAPVSAGAPGTVIGVAVFVLVGTVAVIFFVRYWKQKMSVPNTSLTSNGDCMQVNVVKL
ncbi:thrombomodulin [Clupea harengus]|uniref:Thrombomodulin n=1 Tax=Clupea harengus TaxID=7950 RepID=A0A6P8GA43_CLUHA|nr:thrombomodulin [Clupea harengus]